MEEVGAKVAATVLQQAHSPLEVAPIQLHYKVEVNREALPRVLRVAEGFLVDAIDCRLDLASSQRLGDRLDRVEGEELLGVDRLLEPLEGTLQLFAHFKL